jgi:hypothetical protein
VKRLSSDIDGYIRELNGRAKNARTVPLLQEAKTVAEDGDIDLGWKYFQTARRLELIALTPGAPELVATATSLRKEIDEKLTSWRKEAAKELLNNPGVSASDHANIVEAARHFDHHFNNEAYKDGLRRSGAKWLALFLLAALLLLFWISCKGYLAAATLASGAQGFSLFKALVSVAVVGLLGAVVSAITDLSKSGAPTRIPALVSTFRVTLLRLLMGPASAIFLYFVSQTELANTIFVPEVTKGGYFILAIAFVAGFSERLALRVAQSFDDKPGKSPARTGTPD